MRFWQVLTQTKQFLQKWIFCKSKLSWVRIKKGVQNLPKFLLLRVKLQAQKVASTVIILGFLSTQMRFVLKWKIFIHDINFHKISFFRNVCPEREKFRNHHYHCLRSAHPPVWPVNKSQARPIIWRKKLKMNWKNEDVDLKNKVLTWKAGIRNLWAFCGAWIRLTIPKKKRTWHNQESFCMIQMPKLSWLWKNYLQNQVQA